MRSKDFGQIAGISKSFSESETLEMFEKICICRNFELNVKKVHEQGLIKFPIYLSLGQEPIPAALSVAYKSPAIFAQHRAHSFYLSYGGNVVALIDELLSRPSGCAKGMGGSASIHSPAIQMFGHDGLMGNQAPIAVGYSLATKKNTMAVVGDASGEEDYVLGAMGYAATKKLPILFVCTDNGLSILTDVATRRSWKLSDIAQSFGMPAIEITDDPWLIMHHAKNLSQKLPAYMNIHTVRELWHAGTGKDHEPEWNRYALIKEELARLGFEKKAEEIETRTKEYIDKLWEQQLKINV